MAAACAAASPHVRCCFAPAARAGRQLALLGSCWLPLQTCCNPTPLSVCRRACGRLRGGVTADVFFARATFGRFGCASLVRGRACGGLLGGGCERDVGRQGLCLVLCGGAMHGSCMSGFLRVCCVGCSGQHVAGGCLCFHSSARFLGLRGPCFGVAVPKSMREGAATVLL